MDNIVLVVDDEQANRDLVGEYLAAFLGREGGVPLNILKASSAEEALALLVEHTPRAIVSDLHMGGMTGLELLRRVRAREALKDVSFVLLTGTKLDAQTLEELRGLNGYFVLKATTAGSDRLVEIARLAIESDPCPAP